MEKPTDEEISTHFARVLKKLGLKDEYAEYYSNKPIPVRKDTK